VHLKAILFDVDGTLSDTEDAHRVAFNETFQAEGLDWRWNRDLYKRLLTVNGGVNRIRYFVDTENLDTGFDGSERDDFISRLHAKKTHRFAGFIEDGRVRLRSGVARLIRDAQGNGLRLAIATATSLSNVEKLLSSCLPSQDADAFEVFGTGERAVRKKPDPEIYLWVLEQLALPPRACIAIEDSTNGLNAARSAGIATVITTSPYTLDEDFTGAVAVVDRLGEPDKPSRFLQGDGLNKTCVDVELLRHWHSQTG